MSIKPHKRLLVDSETAFLWSALAWQRFGLLRLVAAGRVGGLRKSLHHSVAHESGDKSPYSKERHLFAFTDCGILSRVSLRL